MWLVGFALWKPLASCSTIKKGLYADCGMEFYYLNDGIRLVAVEPPQEDPPRPTSCLFHPLQGGTEDGSAGALPVGCHLLAHSSRSPNSNVPLADAFYGPEHCQHLGTGTQVSGAVVHSGLPSTWSRRCSYFYKDIPFKASLYALYVVIAIFGYLKWRKMIKK